MVAATAAQQKLVALQVGATGTASALLAKDDPLPGTTDTVRGFGPSATDGQHFFLMAYDSAYSPNVLTWRDGAWRRLAGPGMPVGELGTIQAIESSYPKPAAGKAYLAVRINTGTSTIRGIVAAGTDGITPVVIPAKLDARRVAASYVVDAAPEKLLFLVDFVGGGRALYANVAPSDEAPTLRLEFTRPNSSTLRFNVPSTAELQAAPSLSGPWETLLSGDAPIVPGNRFFKLRQR